jgi:PAS domain S-box-containing protein
VTQELPARRRAKRPQPGFDQRLLALALLSGLPGSAVSLVLLAAGGYAPKVFWTLAVLIVAMWLGFAFAVRRRAVIPLQTLSNLLAALRESDFSIRGRGAHRDDSLGEVTREVNELAETLREQRWGALEATALLERIMEEIDVALFAFDHNGALRLLNRAGEQLLALPAERLIGRSAGELGLDRCLDQDTPRILEAAFPGGAGRWEVRRGEFRQGGLPMRLLVLTDMSRALRQEEAHAWQRLIRVLGHEMNNSLAPIHSIAGSLEALVARRPLPEDWDEDLRRGLAVISGRAASLSRFLEAYARLSQLPPPRRQPLDLGALVRRVAGLEPRLTVGVDPGPESMVDADGDQIEQLLINLVHNAADAALETGGGVTIGWSRGEGVVEVAVRDEGPGLSNTSNLFVPFFTTKPGGSGIGLVLSRQIAEAHGGSLTVANRAAGRGCEATLRLPAGP